jgi:hypothetical protein
MSLQTMQRFAFMDAIQNKADKMSRCQWLAYPVDTVKIRSAKDQTNQ